MAALLEETPSTMTPVYAEAAAHAATHVAFVVVVLEAKDLRGAAVGTLGGHYSDPFASISTGEPEYSDHLKTSVKKVRLPKTFMYNAHHFLPSYMQGQS